MTFWWLYVTPTLGNCIYSSHGRWWIALTMMPHNHLVALIVVCQSIPLKICSSYAKCMQDRSTYGSILAQCIQNRSTIRSTSAQGIVLRVAWRVGSLRIIVLCQHKRNIPTYPQEMPLSVVEMSLKCCLVQREIGVGHGGVARSKGWCCIGVRHFALVSCTSYPSVLPSSHPHLVVHLVFPTHPSCCCI